MNTKGLTADDLRMVEEYRSRLLEIRRPSNPGMVKSVNLQVAAYATKLRKQHEESQEIRLSEGELKALLRTQNEPQFLHPEAIPYLESLIEKKLLKNDNRGSGATWWKITPAGKKVIQEYVTWPSAKKNEFLTRTHNLFW